jgi:hypothetical protein
MQLFSSRRVHAVFRQRVGAFHAPGMSKHGASSNHEAAFRQAYFNEIPSFFIEISLLDLPFDHNRSAPILSSEALFWQILAYFSRLSGNQSRALGEARIIMAVFS